MKNIHHKRFGDKSSQCNRIVQVTPVKKASSAGGAVPSCPYKKELVWESLSLELHLPINAGTPSLPTPGDEKVS